MRGGGKLFFVMNDFFSTNNLVQGPRLVLLGGFLGAGKTTMLGHLAGFLKGKGLRPGFVTNDQGQGLMDTQSALTQVDVNAVREITGGCFCCRLPDLVKAMDGLCAEERPDVILAEPVGSCTDLVATVILPLQQIYQRPLRISPYPVLLDSRRAYAVLGGKKLARDFHRDVGYIYRKQMEEAEWLVLNKADLLTTHDLEDVQERLHHAYPDKRVFITSAKTGMGLEEFWEALLVENAHLPAIIDVDYDRYAVGEAMMGWVNMEVSCAWKPGTEAQWGEWLLEIASLCRETLIAMGCEPGHCKMSLQAGYTLWRTHLVMSDEVPTLHVVQTAEVMDTPRLLVNLRAEGDARKLEDMILALLGKQEQVSVVYLQRAAFQPGKPVPTHRIGAAV